MKGLRMRKLSATEERLLELQTLLKDWTSFVTKLEVPGDLAPAFVTGRIELLKLATPRELTAEECGTLYKLIGGLVETNHALQEHSRLVAELASEVRRGIGGMEGLAHRLGRYAEFKTPDDIEIEPGN